MPALRSSAPTADENLRPLASTWPMKPKSGACTESAMSAHVRARRGARRTGSPSRIRSRSRSRRRVAALEESSIACLGRLPGREPRGADADPGRHPAIVGRDVIGSRREGDDAPRGLRGRLGRQAHDRRRRLVADRPGAVVVRHRAPHPGSLGPGEHGARVLGRARSTRTGRRSCWTPTRTGEQTVAFGGEFEVGRPPGLKPGTPLDFPVAVNSTPLPLEPGRYEWRLTIDGTSREDWTLPFTVRGEEA